MTEHEIRVEPHWQARGVIVVCSCAKFRRMLGTIDDPAPLRDIIDVARQHVESAENAEIADRINARGLLPVQASSIGLQAARDRIDSGRPTHELHFWHQEWRPIAADVPAQGYVHGLDPAEDDPRRVFP